MIFLGYKVKDKLTGYTGIVAARVIYLYNGPQVLVVSALKNKTEHKEGIWFSEKSVTVVRPKLKRKKVKGRKNV